MTMTRRPEPSLVRSAPEMERGEHPIDLVERLAQIREWTHERTDEDEITITMSGSWCSYQLAFTWIEDLETLHLACAFDFKAPEHRRAELAQLVTMINEQMWVGHFDLWQKEHVVMFRHALLLTGGIEASSSQCEALMEIAVEACDRHYQGFQFVVWAGKSAREALDASLFETQGIA
jgi:hypothetical protein